VYPWSALSQERLSPGRVSVGLCPCVRENEIDGHILVTPTEVLLSRGCVIKARHGNSRLLPSSSPSNCRLTPDAQVFVGFCVPPVRDISLTVGKGKSPHAPLVEPQPQKL
jgi:hypothetical protein